MSQYPVGKMSPIEQQEILREIGEEILREHPRKGDRVVYERMEVAGYGSSLLLAEHEGGDSEQLDSIISLLAMCDRLRYGMYQEDKGTWFSMKYIITRPSRYTVEFNYDDRPPYQFAPDSILYAEDLKQFPRSPENIPGWLQEELRKAEAEQG